jgi:hypothetical protein
VRAAQAIEPFPAVGPGPQLPPASDERFPVGGRQRDAVPAKYGGQRFALEGIEIAPRGTAPDLVHRGLICVTPVIDNARPISLHFRAGCGGLGDVDQAGPPVDKRSEHVEQQDARRLHNGQYLSVTRRGQFGNMWEGSQLFGVL